MLFEVEGIFAYGTVGVGGGQQVCICVLGSD